MYFAQIKKIGIENLIAIKGIFGDFRTASTASIDDYSPIISDNNITDQVADLLHNIDGMDAGVKRKYGYLEKNAISFIPIYSDKFPETLRRIPNPPPYLFVRGELPLEMMGKSASIVGTRDPSLYGHTKARELARDLAAQGFVIVSGLARGTDLEAHLGALEAGGITIAVLGSGVDKIYPEENTEIANDILRLNGAIISEFDVGQEIKKYSLVQRNRIISGLSNASIVIEGSLESGTTHEVAFARKQGKPLFVLNPTEVDRKTSELPRKLKDEGVPAICSARDFLVLYNEHNPLLQPPAAMNTVKKANSTALGDNSKKEGSKKEKKAVERPLFPRVQKEEGHNQ